MFKVILKLFTFQFLFYLKSAVLKYKKNHVLKFLTIPYTLYKAHVLNKKHTCFCTSTLPR